MYYFLLVFMKQWVQDEEQREERAERKKKKTEGKKENEVKDRGIKGEKQMDRVIQYFCRFKIQDVSESGDI